MSNYFFVEECIDLSGSGKQENSIELEVLKILISIYSVKPYLIRYKNPDGKGMILYGYIRNKNEICILNKIDNNLLASNFREFVDTLCQQGFTISFRTINYPVVKPCASSSLNYYTLETGISIEEIWSGLNSKVKNMIRKAEKNEVEIMFSSSSYEVEKFYELYSSHLLSKAVSPHAYEYVKEICNHNDGGLLLAKKNGKIIAGLAFIIIGRECYYPFHSSNSAANRLSPNQILLWSLIKHCVSERVLLLHIGESSVGSGVDFFKRSFSSRSYLLHRNKIISRDGEAHETRRKIMQIFYRLVISKLFFPLLSHMFKRSYFDKLYARILLRHNHKCIGI